MPKVFTSENQKLGKIGENIAEKFLMKHGFSIVDRNHTKKWGELDIVAEKGNKLYFIEVKSVSRENLENVSHETVDSYRPEDNMHPWKMKRMARTIQTYLLSNNVPEGKEWQVDLLVVYIDKKARKGRVKVVSDIIL